MNSLILNQLLIENEKNIFSLIATPKNNEYISWHDILEDFKSLLPHKSIDKKVFWGNDLHILDRFGFDIDHEDSYGNTLLFYLFSNSNPDTYLSFETKDILKKTKKLYHKNGINETIIFLMARNLKQVNWEKTEDFISGQNLIEFIEKHPHFDLHQFTSLNRNLLNACMLNNTFPYKLFDYLIHNKLSVNHIDNDGYNLLNMFPLLHFNEKVSQYFVDLCQFNDISHTNKYKENSISTFTNCLASKGQNHQQSSHIQWLQFIYENILNETIFVRNKLGLITTLEHEHADYPFSAQFLIPLEKKTTSFLKFKILDDKFPVKTVHIKKPKI